MAWLEKVGTSRRLTLPSRCLVGRAAHCALRSADRRVSGEHATVVWTGKGWEVRDLGSRNGTFVNDSRLDTGGVRALNRGDALSFGGPGDGWRLADDGPPVATAVEGIDSVVMAEAGLLALPSADEPRATVFGMPSGVLHTPAAFQFVPSQYCKTL